MNREHIETIKNNYRNSTIKEIRDAQFYNEMKDRWTAADYEFDAAMEELIKEKVGKD